MAMAEDIREDDEFENGASVEVEEDQSDEYEVVASDEDSEETRTNVRKKSNGDDELENYSESVQRRINQLTAKRKQASEEAQAAVQYAQTMQQENAAMKQRLQQMSVGYNSETENRLKGYRHDYDRYAGGLTEFLLDIWLHKNNKYQKMIKDLFN